MIRVEDGMCVKGNVSPGLISYMKIIGAVRGVNVF
jgi:hypothetical protein